MKTKPKIAIIAPYWRPARISGTEVANEVVLSALKTKHSPIVITSDSYTVRYFRNILINPRIPSTKAIYRLKHDPFKSFFYHIFKQIHGPILSEFDIIDTLQKLKIDIVYLSSFPHDVNQKVVNGIRKIKLPITIIFQPHFHPLQYQKFNQELHKLCNQVDKILVWTKQEKYRLIKDQRVLKNKIIIVKPPIFQDLKIFTQKKRENNKTITILYAGEKNEHKGIYSLINALQSVSDQKVQLITIGPHDWKWELYKYTHKLPFLQDLGYVSSKTKEAVFSECDIFCLPSHADSFGFAYLDAWRYKKPVIAADTPVMREVIGKGGLLVDRNNPEGFSLTLKKLIENRELRERLGQTGFVSLQRFSYRKNLKSFLKLFE